MKKVRYYFTKLFKNNMFLIVIFFRQTRVTNRSRLEAFASTPRNDPKNCKKQQKFESFQFHVKITCEKISFSS